MRYIVLAAALAACAGEESEPVTRRVDLTFVARGEVISSPSMMVRGPDCQSFTHGLTGAPPAVTVEYCVLPGDELRLRWTVRDGDRVLSHEATGDFADDAAFEAGTEAIQAHVAVSSLSSL